ncbi:MAG TPA: rhodanese-like domain-containing protein [Chitinophagaceae bacterium]|nr:rhodanese-like domain-containing protein [Chitinophagaceae bacterium]
MKKIILFLLSFYIAAQSISAQQPVIVSPQWLKENINDTALVVLYTGFVIKADYDREHIEGSRFLWPEWLAYNTPEANMVSADTKTATKVLQDLGINKNSKIVIYHRGGDVTIASRMFLSLEHYGLKGQVSFLNGGIEAWKKSGYPVTNTASVFKKGNFVASDNKLLVDKNYVLNALNTNSSELVDARLKRWYDGDPTGNPRDGHISGAKNVPYPDMIDSTNTFKNAEVLSKNFTSVVPEKNKEVIVYCFIGQTASVDYLVGRSLGYKMKLYDGSMQEWSRDEKLPMEKAKKD